MKHIFIVNPTAGKGKASKKIIPEIEQYFNAHSEISGEIYITKSCGDGMQYVEEISKKGEKVRFYACGGDGTLFEVVNGSYKYENTEVASIPLGSGNDFTRIMGKASDLVNIDAQVNGTPIKLDLIECDGKVAINQCSMGLDAEICAKQAYFKKFPFVGGEMSYGLSVAYCFFEKMDNFFTVFIDGEKVVDGLTLFALCGNSRWYGGGYKGAPLALPDDGFLDFVIVEKKCSRAKLLGLIDIYKKGEHLDLPITTFKRGKEMRIVSKKLSAVNVDGECKYVTESIFKILPSAVNFVIPTTSDYLKRRDKEKQTV
ncbi:MAG: YegS/Rv2252/BmrU family lipid kinase [Oscillospiraceae bacterium]